MLSYCSLASGSSGNVNLVQSSNTKILFDVGKSRKYIIDSLNKLNIDISEIDAVFITHEHKDHIGGLRVLSKFGDFKVYINRKSYDVVAEELIHVDKSRIVFIDNDEEIFVKDIKIIPFKVLHDSENCHGYNIDCEEKRISIATDIGAIYEGFYKNFLNSNLISIESNHDERLVTIGKYPYYLKRRILGGFGHISNIEVANMLVEVCKENDKLRQIVLTHLSIENNYPELAKQTTEDALREEEIIVDNDVKVDIALKDTISPIYVI